MAKLKGYIKNDVYAKYRERYKQCIRMLNGLEKSLERRLPEKERRWAVTEATGEYDEPNPEHRTLNT